MGAHQWLLGEVFMVWLDYPADWRTARPMFNGRPPLYDYFNVVAVEVGDGYAAAALYRGSGPLP
jgi:hypothetical protein